jgi:chemotaxis protein histidine kinase CheA
MKPLADALCAGDTVSGTTLLGDGRVAMILDVPAILREVAKNRPQGPVIRSGEP